MAINYPTSLDNLTNPSSSSSLQGHAQQHADANDAIEALEAKVGVNNSTIATSHDYRIKSLENSTSDRFSEGSNNLYFTQERAQDAIGSLFNAGSHSGISFTYDDIKNGIDSQISQEYIQDIIAPLITHGNHVNISATYDDSDNKIILSTSGSGGGSSQATSIQALSSAPISPTQGSVYFDINERTIKVYNGNIWYDVAGPKEMLVHTHDPLTRQVDYIDYGNRVVDNLVIMDGGTATSVFTGDIIDGGYAA